MSTPFIVAVAPNGARRGKADHPGLPLTPDELAREAGRCREAGASLFHVHIRDETGRHSLDPDRYLAALAAIRRTVGDGLVLQITTESVGLYRPQAQMEAVRAVRPEAASLAVRELCPTPSDVPEFEAFLKWMKAQAILPQFLLYDEADLTWFGTLWRDGAIPFGGPSVLRVIGGHDSAASDLNELRPFLDRIDGLRSNGLEGTWFACAFGAVESAAVMAAAAFGGHARVGFENNILLPDGSIAPDNSSLAALAATAGRLAGRTIADAATTRRLIGG